MCHLVLVLLRRGPPRGHLDVHTRTDHILSGKGSTETVRYPYPGLQPGLDTVIRLPQGLCLSSTGVTSSSHHHSDHSDDHSLDDWREAGHEPKNYLSSIIQHTPLVGVPIEATLSIRNTLAHPLGEENPRWIHQGVHKLPNVGFFTNTLIW